MIGMPAKHYTPESSRHLPEARLKEPDIIPEPLIIYHKGKEYREFIKSVKAYNKSIQKQKRFKIKN